MNRYLANPRWLFALSACALASTVRGEVGAVSLAAPSSSPSPIYVFSPVDDPDPVPKGIVWRRFSQSSTWAVLNEQGEANQDGPPSLAGNLVVWARNSAAGYDVVFSQFTGGAWTAPIVVAGSVADELDPFVLQAADGSFDLFYWEMGAAPRVLHRRASPDPSSWTAPEQVSQQNLAACRPSATWHGGDLYVIYEVHDYGFGNTPRQIVVARLDSGTFVPEVVAVTQNPGEIWPEIHSRGGRLWVDWIESTGQMYWMRRESSGSWTAAQPEPYSNSLQRDFFVRGTIRYHAMQ